MVNRTVDAALSGWLPPLETSIGTIDRDQCFDRRSLRHRSRFQGGSRDIRCLRATARIAVLALFVAGCQQPQPIGLATDEAELDPAGPTIAVAALVDDRQGDTSVDEVLEPTFLEEIKTGIVSTLEGSGLFSRIVRLEDAAADPPYDPADFVLTPSLTRLEWTVPDYDEKLAAGFGLIGAVVVSSIHTDVYDDAGLRMLLEDRRAGSNVIDRVYAGHCEVRKSLAACDTSETKAEVVRTALEEALDSFAEDMAGALSQQDSAQDTATGN